MVIIIFIIIISSSSSSSIIILFIHSFIYLFICLFGFFVCVCLFVCCTPVDILNLIFRFEKVCSIWPKGCCSVVI